MTTKKKARVMSKKERIISILLVLGILIITFLLMRQNGLSSSSLTSSILNIPSTTYYIGSTINSPTTELPKTSWIPSTTESGTTESNTTEISTTTEPETTEVSTTSSCPDAIFHLSWNMNPVPSDFVSSSIECHNETAMGDPIGIFNAGANLSQTISLPAAVAPGIVYYCSIHMWSTAIPTNGGSIGFSGNFELTAICDDESSHQMPSPLDGWHSECDSRLRCISKPGYAPGTCLTDDNCKPAPSGHHFGCNTGGKCQLWPGDGPDTCNRDMSSPCPVPPPPSGSHLGCSEFYDCRPFPGAGENTCLSNYDCATQSNHLACNTLGQCVSTPGAGPNTCDTSTPCPITPPPSGYHLACNSSEQCVSVAGNGINLCDSHSFCSDGGHMGCNADMQCVPVAGIGFDACGADPDCYSEDEEPETPEYPLDPPFTLRNQCNYETKQCVLTLGQGPASCTNNDACKCPVGQIEKTFCDYTVQSSFDMVNWVNTGTTGGPLECTVDSTKTPPEANINGSTGILEPLLQTLCGGAPKCFLRMVTTNQTTRCVSATGSSVLAGNTENISEDASTPSLWSRIMNFFSSLFSFLPWMSSDILNNTETQATNTTGTVGSLRNVHILTQGASQGDALTLVGTEGVPVKIDTSKPFKYSLPEGSKITVTATPGSNSKFIEWKGGCQKTEGATCLFTVTRAKGVTAVFEPLPKYALTTSTSGNGKGTISGLKNPIFGYASIVELLNPGSSITLTALPTSGSVFTGWSGACTGTGACTVVMNGDKSVMANFVTKVNGICGTTPNTCIAGTLVDTTDSALQYKWDCVGLNGGITNSCTADKPITYTLSTTKNGTGTGTITSSIPGINCGNTLYGNTPDCAEAYNQNAVITLNAIPDAGITHSGWSGCTSVSGTTCTVQMNSTKTVTATFNKPTYNLSITKTGTGTGTALGTFGASTGFSSGSFPVGSTITITAKPATGSTFTGWTGCTTVSGTTCTVQMSSAKTVTANFELPAYYTVKFNISGTGGGLVRWGTLGTGAITGTTTKTTILAIKRGAAFRYTVEPNKGTATAVITGTCKGSCTVNSDKTIDIKLNKI